MSRLGGTSLLLVTVPDCVPPVRQAASQPGRTLAGVAPARHGVPESPGPAGVRPPAVRRVVLRGTGAYILPKRWLSQPVVRSGQARLQWQYQVAEQVADPQLRTHHEGLQRVQQRCNRGATAGSTGMQQKFNGGDASKSAMRAELRRRRRGWWWVGGGGGADAATIRCSDCSDGGGGAGAGRAGQDDAGGDWSRQAARPVAARRPPPARHGVHAVATGPTSCRFAPAPPRLRCSRRPRDGTGRRGRGGGLTGGALRRRGPGPSGRQLGPRPCCSGGATRPRPRPRGAWGAWGRGGRGGRGRGDCGGDPRVVDV